MFNRIRSFRTLSGRHSGPDADESLLRASPCGRGVTVSNRGWVFELLAAVSRCRVKLKGRNPPRWLGQAEEFLRAHFSEHLNLVTVSEAVGVHVVHLAREFRKHYACTAGDYIRHLRIEYACREMGRSGSSLAEIASAAGFSDQSHFSKVFRRFTGMTPAEYRATLSIR